MKNNKVVLLSVVALVCIVLTFVVNWVFILPAIFIWWWNRKELNKK